MAGNSGSHLFLNFNNSQNSRALNEDETLMGASSQQEGGIFLDLSLQEIIRGEGGNDTIIGSRSRDTIEGNAGTDSLLGNTDNDSLNGNADDDTVYGGAGDDTVDGGEGNDRLCGDFSNDGTPLMEGFGNDLIFGGGGNDEIDGNQGNDRLDGEAGSDTINGAEGNDVAIGGTGNDLLAGDTGDDRIFGGEGDDAASGGDGNDEIFGEAGNDLLDGNQGSDRIDGGIGNDFLRGENPADPTADPFLIGLNLGGSDVLIGGEGDDTAFGAEGNDQIFGNTGNDLLFGNIGIDLIFGGQGIDTIYGGKDSDDIFGDLGNDLLYGDIGDDRVNGGEGNDLIFANQGNDFTNGNQGDDTVYGGQNNDTIRGGQGNDILFGDLGDDFLFGDLGLNTLTGGEGSDRFALAPGTGDFLQTATNFVTDFTDGVDFLEFTQGTTFEQLIIRQGVGENANNTVILDSLTGAITVLQNINVSNITREDFLPPEPPPVPETPAEDGTPLPPPTLGPIPTPPQQPQPPQPPEEPEPEPEEPGTLQFSTATYTVNENGTPQITISRVNGTQGDVSVTVSITGGTATAGDDFENTNFPLTVNIPDGQNSASVPLTVIDDGVVDANPTETVELTLSNPTNGATLGGTTSATLNIVDIDNAGIIQFNQAQYSLDENGGTVTVEVQRVGGSSGQVTVPLNIGAGTPNATRNTDYTDDLPAQIVFADRDVSPKTYTITGVDDTAIEGTENIQLSLGTPSGTATLGTPNSATVSILDDDVPTITVSAADDEADEGDPTNTGQFVVSSDLAAPAGGITVNIAAGGTATEGTDYSNIGTSVVIPAGQTTVNLPVEIPAALNDTDAEGPETVELTVQAPTTPTDYNVGPAPDNSATVTIVDDDVPTVSIAASNARLAENDPANTSTLTVTLTGGITAPITVDLNLGGSATQGDDFTVSGTSVTFNPSDVGADGTATKTLTVTPQDDAVREPNEIARFRLASAPGGEYALASEQNNQQATVTFLDDETSQLLFGVADPLASEVGDDITGALNISRFGGSANPITVNYEIDTTVANAATPGEDYDTSSLPGFDPVTNQGSVTIPVAQESVPITINPVDDGIAAGLPNEALTEFIVFNLLPGTGYEDPTAIPAATIQLINNAS